MAGPRLRDRSRPMRGHVSGKSGSRATTPSGCNASGVSPLPNGPSPHRNLLMENQSPIFGGAPRRNRWGDSRAVHSQGGPDPPLRGRSRSAKIAPWVLTWELPQSEWGGPGPSMGKGPSPAPRTPTSREHHAVTAGAILAPFAAKMLLTLPCEHKVFPREPHGRFPHTRLRKIALGQPPHIWLYVRKRNK